MRFELKEILILFAHPAYQKSRVNKRLLENIHKIEGVTLHDLYQSYPEMDIDMKFLADKILTCF